MTKHGKTTRVKYEKADKKRRTKQQDSQSQSSHLHTPDQEQLSLTETPFSPRMDEHVAILSTTPSSAQRQEFIMRLNKTYGMMYVQRLLESMNAQAKLTVSQPGDMYEQEANRVAETVTKTPAVQKAASPEEEEELVQGKLQRQEVPEEEELATKLQRQEVPEDEEGPIQTKLQRQEVPEEEEEEVQPKPILQRETLEVGPQIDSDIEGKIDTAKGSGELLSENIRKPMEQAFGADFGGVRVHNNSEADSLNQSLQARAFTNGQHIFFKQGEYNPDSSAGKQLLAHELTHTIQQTGKKEPMSASTNLSSPADGQTAFRATAQQPPPIPSKVGRPPAPPRLTPGETYGSKPVEGMDRLTYDQAIEKFTKWKKPRLFGGLSKSKRKLEAEKYLAEVVGRSKKFTSHTPLMVNSILAAYKDTFDEELSLRDEMQELQQIGSGVSAESTGKSMGEVGNEAERERKEELISGVEGSIGSGFTLGEEGSKATQALIDVIVPKDTQGKSFSQSEKGQSPMEITGGATDIFSGVGQAISSIFGFAKAARLNMKKQGYEKVTTIIDAVGSGLGALAKGASGVVGVVKGAIKAGGGPLEIVKQVLGPIPDMIKTVFSTVKSAYAAFKGKTKESLESAWDATKNGVSSIMGTISTVFSLISTMGDAVPIVGAVANGISAILNGIEAAYMFVKKVAKYISLSKLINKILEKAKEIQAKPAKNQAEKADKKARKDRLVYIGKNNVKKQKNVSREITKQEAALVGNGAKLIGAVSSLVGEITALTGVGAPVGAVFKAFGVASNIFGSVVNGIGAAVTFVPKLFNSLRQVGRNLAAKEGKTGKFFKALGFNPEKSSAKKHEERKKVIVGIFNDAAKLKTDFDDPSGKDRENVKAELTKFKDMEFEIEATGADKSELYKENKEENDEKRTEKQVKILYDALKER